MRVLLRAGLAGALTGALVLGITFGRIGLVSDAAQGAATSLAPAPRVMALALFLALCLAWGVATDLVARRWTAT